jgi:hypothetical protein
MGLILPDLVRYANFSNESEFLNALYEYFKQDFVYTKPVYKGTKLWLKRLPLRDEREATFYHITTTGKDENNRTLDIPRAERIRWIKPIIEIEDKKILVWENERKKEENILLYLKEENFLIVLRKRKHGILFWTSYYTDKCYKHKLLREYENYHKMLKTPFIQRT